MPPAFILSQDQTLNKLYLKQHLCRIKIDLLKFNLFQNKSQNRILFYTRSSARVLKEPFYFWCLKALLAFLTLFNFQGTQRSVQRSLTKISHSTSFVKNFFKFFELYFVLARVSRDSLVILPPQSPFVNTIFEVFPPFLCLL